MSSFSVLEIQYVLDAKKDKAKRLFFLTQENISTKNRTISISKSREWEDEFEVYLSPGNINDKLTALDLQVDNFKNVKNTLIGTPI